MVNLFLIRWFWCFICWLLGLIGRLDTRLHKIHIKNKELYKIISMNFYDKSLPYKMVLVLHMLQGQSERHFFYPSSRSCWSVDPRLFAFLLIIFQTIQQLSRRKGGGGGEQLARGGGPSLSSDLSLTAWQKEVLIVSMFVIDCLILPLKQCPVQCCPLCPC